MCSSRFTPCAITSTAAGRKKNELYGLGHGLIGQDVFPASVIIVLVTTMITPPLLRLVFPAVERHHVAVEEAIAESPDDVHRDAAATIAD